MSIEAPLLWLWKMDPGGQNCFWLRITGIELLSFSNNHFAKSIFIKKFLCRSFCMKLQKSTCAPVISLGLLFCLVEKFKRNFFFERDKSRSWKYRQVEKWSFNENPAGKKEYINDSFWGYSSVSLDGMHKIGRVSYWLLCSLSNYVKVQI